MGRETVACGRASAILTEHDAPNGLRLSGARKGVRCSRGSGGGAPGRPWKRRERSAKSDSRVLKSLSGTRNRRDSGAIHPPRPCLPRLKHHFVTTRLRVDLLSRDQQTSFEFLDGRPDSTDWPASFYETLEQTLRVDREAFHLPP